MRAPMPPPALADYDGRLYMFFKRGDHKVGYAWMKPDGSWAHPGDGKPWITVDGKDKWTQRTPSAASFDDALHVAFKSGSHGVQALKTVWSSNGKYWQGGDDLRIDNKVIESKYGPSIAVLNGSLIMVYLDGDGNVMQTRLESTSGNWSTPIGVGHLRASSNPVLSRYGDKAALSVEENEKTVLYLLAVT